MKTEYELRILEINHDEMVNKLESLGAVKKFDAMQQRYVYDLKPVDPNRWIRLRTNGIKTTLTIKTIEDLTISGTKEQEIEVNDFEKTNDILETLGYQNRGFQQNKRIQYMLNDVEIDLDSWPHIPEYMEIEGPNVESVLNVLNLLGIKEENTTTLDVQSIYSKYGYDLKQIKNLSFDEEEQ